MRAARVCKTESGKENLQKGVTQLNEAAKKLALCENIDSLRGIDGRQQQRFILPDSIR